LNSKRKKSTQRKGILKNKKLIAIPIISVIIIVSISIVSFTLFQTPSKFSLKAAIVDQLEQHFQNDTFRETVTNILTDAGFNTTYYDYEAVNVTFYQELAKKDYGIIILRSHSALRNDNSTVDLFTSEIYNNQSYRQMWADGYLSEGKYLFEPNSNTTYFAVTSKLIENLDGNFPRSVVIAMGCWSLRLETDQLAQAFLNKGAEVYIGWNNVILPKDTDRETINLLEMLVTQNKPLAQAVSQIKIQPYMAENNVTVQTWMNFLPPRDANLTLSKLVATARNSANTTFLSNFQNAISLIAKPSLRHRDLLNETTRQVSRVADNA